MSSGSVDATSYHRHVHFQAGRPTTVLCAEDQIPHSKMAAEAAILKSVFVSPEALTACG